MDLWHRRKPAELVKTILQNHSLWGADLAHYDFAAAVQTKLSMLANGVKRCESRFAPASKPNFLHVFINPSSSLFCELSFQSVVWLN
jgi:hypothetical protein